MQFGSIFISRFISWVSVLFSDTKKQAETLDVRQKKATPNDSSEIVAREQHSRKVSTACAL